MNISGDLQPLSQNTERVQTADRASSTHSATQTSSAASNTAASQPALSADQAHLSTAASLVSQALGASDAQFDDVRLDKVAAVQSALADGSYQVSSSQIAGKLIDHMLEGGK